MRRSLSALLLATFVAAAAVPDSVLAADGVPITTRSDAARTAFLEGRALFENLRFAEARAQLQRAVAADSSFAMAHLLLAQTATSTRMFFEQVERAAALAGSVSEPERRWILGFQAGVQGRPADQGEHYRALVAAVPHDPRTHNQLGIHHFTQQRWGDASAALEAATALDPDYAAPYNMLGYARRFAGDMDGAEAAFRRYIELIPDDPNPYDSYAELLLKLGRHDESIASYRQALERDPQFVASHIGIATNHNLMGNHERAHQQLDVMLAGTRNDGERRGAWFARAVSHTDAGQLDAAIACIAVELALAAAIDDALAMAGDHTNMGFLHLEAGRVEAARAHLAAALAVVEASDRSEEIKDNWRRGDLYNRGRLAVADGDPLWARSLADSLQARAAAIDNAFGVRLAHELRGLAALAVSDGATAEAELAQANQQDPYNLYRRALAAWERDDAEAAMAWARQTVDYKALNNLNYGLVRGRAAAMLAHP